MEDSNEITRVIFRKYKSKPHKIIAFFLDHPANYGRIACYEHIGQHGEAVFPFSSYTKPLSAEEYKDLYQELKCIGYHNLKIMKRASTSNIVKNWVYFKNKIEG